MRHVVGQEAGAVEVLALERLEHDRQGVGAEELEARTHGEAQVPGRRAVRRKEVQDPRVDRVAVPVEVDAGPERGLVDAREQPLAVGAEALSSCHYRIFFLIIFLFRIKTNLLFLLLI